MGPKSSFSSPSLSPESSDEKDGDVFLVPQKGGIDAFPWIWASSLAISGKWVLLPEQRVSCLQPGNFSVTACFSAGCFLPYTLPLYLFTHSDSILYECMHVCVGEIQFFAWICLGSGEPYLEVLRDCLWLSTWEWSHTILREPHIELEMELEWAKCKASALPNVLSWGSMLPYTPLKCQSLPPASMSCPHLIADVSLTPDPPSWLTCLLASVFIFVLCYSWQPLLAFKEKWTLQPPELPGCAIFCTMQLSICCVK